MEKISREDFDREVDKLAKLATDKGLIIEAGFIGYRKFVMEADAGPFQVLETRRAFFAGAQHLFGSIMGILDPGSEPTDADLARMDNIDRELRRFADEIRTFTRKKMT